MSKKMRDIRNGRQWVKSYSKEETLKKIVQMSLLAPSRNSMIKILSRLTQKG